MSTVLAGALGLLLAGAIGASALALRRNFSRQRIRERQGIYGSEVEDCCGHCCCSCCSVCQEAREAKLAGLPARDYCSGDLLLPEETDTEDDMTVLLQETLAVSFSGLLRKVSRTSKFLLVMNALVALLACSILIFSDKAQNILILVLVFVQPVVILYFMYWRWLQPYTNLDYVVKMFAVGFWFTVFQSIVIESILQVVLVLIYSMFAATAPTDDYYTDDDTGTVPSRQQMVVVVASELGKILGLQVNSNGEEGSHTETDDSPPPPPLFIFMMYQVSLAYILAAGTEETMKHFAVRCCQFASPLQSPQAVLMYLFSAALGFATSENIEYVFGFSSARKQSVASQMEQEIFVLAIRVLMPVHLICSVLQASSLSLVSSITSPHS